MDHPGDIAESSLPAAWRTLAARGVPRRFGKGMLLIQEGDRDDTLFIILAGRVQAFSKDDQESGREIVYNDYGPADFVVGEMSLDGGPRSASVRAIEPTHCVAVTRQTLREHIAANPEFAFELLAHVIGRARAATKAAREIAFFNVYDRVTRLLNGLAVERPDGTRIIQGSLTHKSIASRAGCSREMVSRLMKDLETGGFVATEGRDMVLRRRLPSGW
ncbi:Crp/Fnr family transcriptional regulator [Piscinibacter terrae]|uniref:Crp/Fnr family transcriptional regulator n=1 Tax=Piscinibacter terrae TaxID=2496871 RepID=A0A3N7HT69_9BURK|nr:cyclic nucleotide-binding domain-containing protein [Albitalea terrae]RQP24466.1 Crp/Fnr family transcriptional regulator [Albitalea terrae]